MDSFKSKIFPLINRVKKRLTSFSVFFKKKTGLLKLKFNKRFKYNEIDMDRKLVQSLSKSKIPNLKQIKYINKFLDKKDIFWIKIFSSIIVISVSVWSWNFYRNNVQVVPKVGGVYTEGVVGTPQHLNPLYSEASDVDSDITSLVFSGLFRRDKNGNIVEDLAEGYEISEDGKTYTVKIKDAKWHTDETVTTDDIVFTFNAIKEKEYKSILRSSFLGVNIEKVDDKTVNFTLEEPYVAFPELLTFGILPQNLWLQIMPESASLTELNLKPIGSGPYKFEKLIKDKSGNIKAYEFKRNEDYYGDKPYVETLVFKFFVSFEELIQEQNNNGIDGIGYLPRYMKGDLIAQDSLNIYNLNLPQLTAVFFNQKNNALLEDKNVRKALALAVNKQEILNKVFSGSARLIDGPILPENFAYNDNLTKYNFDQENAKKLLAESEFNTKEITEEEWKEASDIVNATTTEEEVLEENQEVVDMGVGKWLEKDGEYLKITLTTVDSEDNVAVVELIKNSWEAIGVKTVLNIVPAVSVQVDVIKPRDFEALFYGQVVGHDPDSYVFWHSSQTGEGGLNLSEYVNEEVDKLLESARLTSDMEKRKEEYKKFQEILTEDVPAIFMYSPVYTYVQSKKIKNFDIKNILIPHDRFANIAEWYIKTKKKIILE